MNLISCIGSTFVVHAERNKKWITLKSFKSVAINEWLLITYWIYSRSIHINWHTFQLESSHFIFSFLSQITCPVKGPNAKKAQLKCFCVSSIAYKQKTMPDPRGQEFGCMDIRTLKSCGQVKQQSAIDLSSVQRQDFGEIRSFIKVSYCISVHLQFHRVSLFT